MAAGGVAITTASISGSVNTDADVRRSARSLGRGREAFLLEVGDGNERDALLASERGKVGADGDVAKADQRDPEGWLAHRADPNMRY